MAYLNQTAFKIFSTTKKLDGNYVAQLFIAFLESLIFQIIISRRRNPRNPTGIPVESLCSHSDSGSSSSSSLSHNRQFSTAAVAQVQSSMFTWII